MVMPLVMVLLSGALRPRCHFTALAGVRFCLRRSFLFDGGFFVHRPPVEHQAELWKQYTFTLYNRYYILLTLRWVLLGVATVFGLTEECVSAFSRF